MSSTNHNQGVPDALEHVNTISIQVLIEGRDPLPEELWNERSSQRFSNQSIPVPICNAHIYFRQEHNATDFSSEYRCNDHESENWMQSICG